MDFIRTFLDGIDTSVPETVWRYLSLPPDRLWPSVLMVAAFIVVCELTRIAVSAELTRSRLAHLTVLLLTFPVQAITLAVMLVHAGTSHPGRGWINLGIAIAMYVLWYAVGQATRLARPASEGADAGFMAVGALVTVPTGLVVAVVCA
jgi:hypothetical protein